MKKFIKCLSKRKAIELIDLGFIFLYEQNGIYFFEYKDISESEDIKISCLLNFSNEKGRW